MARSNLCLMCRRKGELLIEEHMDSCSFNHPQIVHNEPSCPLCDMRDEYEKVLKEIRDGLEQIGRVEVKDESKSAA